MGCDASIQEMYCAVTREGGMREMKFKLTVTTIKEFETELKDYDEEIKTPEDARKYE